jgi:hypothetical protein
VIDFNRLRRSGTKEAIPLAAGIFLDVLNIFLLFFRLFSRSSNDANSAALHSRNSRLPPPLPQATTPSADNRTPAARRR